MLVSFWYFILYIFTLKPRKKRFQVHVIISLNAIIGYSPKDNKAELIMRYDITYGHQIKLIKIWIILK